jgi:hypothetical protein
MSSNYCLLIGKKQFPFFELFLYFLKEEIFYKNKTSCSVSVNYC